MNSPTKPDTEASEIAAQLSPTNTAGIDSLNVKSGEGYSEKVVDQIEMIGEESAAGMRTPHGDVNSGMRYLHSSRTIHQLVTDRNRAVGIYLAVASLLLTASGALMNAAPRGELIVPMEKVQRWCMPVTFATLTVLAVFVAFLLIRTRAGLIYEVAKMNALLGLPVGRVQRLNPLSIFFVNQAIISFAGGLSAALFSVWMFHLVDREPEHVLLWAAVVGVTVAVALIALYVVTVAYITSDKRLQKLEEKK